MTNKPAIILIVEDHPNTALLLARNLNKFDHPVEVITVPSAEEALALVDEKTIDILITDFMMPGMSGLDLIEKLKGERQPGYIIMITAYDIPGIRLSAQRLHVNEFLLKPIQPERIREIVQIALRELFPSQKGPSGSEQIEQRNFSILIADDNPDNIRLLSIRLKSEGYNSIAAFNGQETLDKIRAEYPDLVLLDVNMPEKDGFEVLSEIRNDPTINYIPVIVVTAARISAKDVRDGLTLGADDYVTKPVDWRELSARIRTKLRVKQAEDALRQRNKTLGILPEISLDMGEGLDIEELTRAVLIRTSNALNASNGYLIAFNPDGSVNQQVYKYFDFSPWNWDDFRHKFANSPVITNVMASREALIIENVTANSDWTPIPNDTTHSAMIIPLQGRKESLGLIVLMHDKPGFFKQDQLRLVQAVASQAAIAIENAQLYTIERKRVNELVALNQLTNRISQFTHTAELLEQIPSLVREHLNYPTVVLWSNKDGNLELSYKAAEENAPRKSLLEIAAKEALQSGLPTQFSGSIEERTGDRFGVGRVPVISNLAVPLFWSGRLGGVLSIHSRQSGSFSESDRVLLETLSVQIGNVIERISLFESVEYEQKRIAAVLQTAADAIMVFSIEGTLQLINPAGRRLFTDIDTKIDHPIPMDRGYNELISLLEKARKTGINENGEIHWPDGRTFSTLISPISEGGVVAVLHDVSQFKSINRLKDEFLATATHDLKNPIFAVMGYADLLSRAGSLNDIQTDFVRRIRNSASQMQDLVLNLLEMARLELDSEIKRESVNLKQLVEEVVEEFFAAADAKRHKITLDLSEDELLVMGDRNRLAQVARNLIGNAIKYTPADGNILIRIYSKKRIVYLQVQDNGIGIPPDALPHLFEKFYRVHNEGTQDIEGNGLGLAIVNSIIAQHDGHIEVDSTLGIGSCFTISLNQLIE